MKRALLVAFWSCVFYPLHRVFLLVDNLTDRAYGRLWKAFHEGDRDA